MNVPHRLRVEHLDGTALGIHETTPRLSWQLPPGAMEQRAYEVELGDGRTARFESPHHVLVPWPFEPLRSREAITWRVRIWTTSGASSWSDRVSFETGLLEPADWQARWIEPHEPERLPSGERPVYVLRHEFEVDDGHDGTERPARLYATARGIYETFLNGRRVGDLELTPGFTTYPVTLQVQTYDVTDLLSHGTNHWTVLLSDGWFRGRHGIDQRADNYGTTVAFLGQISVGSSTVATGPDWMSTTGPIRHADLMAGQYEDHRVDDGPWNPVGIVEHDLGVLTSSPAPPVRRIETIRPRSVTRLSPTRQIVDLGQNITGWMHLSDLGPADTDITLVHAEALGPSGDITLDHLGVGDRAVRQIDRVISAGIDGDTFEPRHTIHGFQYVQVDGAPPFTPDDATGVVVHTDLRRTGWFRCSDDRLNRLHEIADWSLRDNACDIPTDCPHRERQGWTGDWQIFLPSAAFLYDVAGFSLKWLRSLAAEQLPDGLLPNYVPDPRRWKAVETDDLTWYGLLGSAGWGDASVLVPWELYRLYGDRAILDEMWPTMTRWLGYAAESARTKRHPARAAARPTPLPHEEFLWDGGWHWGEWCEPVADSAEPWYAVDQGHVATAYLHRSASIAAEIARLLGHSADAAAFDLLAARALDAWRGEYLADDGSLTPDTQANHVRALAFGLVPDELRQVCADRLVQLIREAGTHLNTGFLATPMLLPVLADHGHLDVAYELLLQDTEPSWLTMVDRGASTVWEVWNGIDEHGVAHESLNHYSKGAVISFLHRYVAGIRPDPDDVAYRRFRIEPRPGGALTAAGAVHDSPYGRIESSWRIDASSESPTFELTTTVPPGTTADVHLPDGTQITVGPGTTLHHCTLG